MLGYFHSHPEGSDLIAHALWYLCVYRGVDAKRGVDLPSCRWTSFLVLTYGLPPPTGFSVWWWWHIFSQTKRILMQDSWCQVHMTRAKRKSHSLVTSFAGIDNSFVDGFMVEISAWLCQIHGSHVLDALLIVDKTSRAYFWTGQTASAASSSMWEGSCTRWDSPRPQSEVFLERG